MGRARLAIAKNAGEIEDSRFAGRQKLLAGKFGRGVKIPPVRFAGHVDEIGGEGVKMGLVAGRNLQDASLDLDEAEGLETAPQGRLEPVSGQQKRAPVAVPIRLPPWGEKIHAFV